MGKYSKDLQKRVLTRGPDYGYCAICSSHGQLTKDHVPPKGCGNVNDVELRHFQSNNQLPARQSQGGAHFKTICSSCNNHLLGLEYDPSLNDLYSQLSKRMHQIIESGLAIPRNLELTIKPQRVARAIIGHLFAARPFEKIGEKQNHAETYHELVNYFMGSSAALPSNVEIFYWFYPYPYTRVLRCVSKSSLHWRGSLLGDILKFPPIGFWLVYDRPSSVGVPLKLLMVNREMGIDDEKTLYFDLSYAMSAGFPEEPESHEWMLYDYNSTFTSIEK